MQKTKLQKELENYVGSKGEFTPFYPGMNILTSNLYKQQLQEILKELEEENTTDVKKFKIYFDTIIINMHTKVKKYKKSVYFDDENIRDMLNQEYIIPFYIDEERKTYILLGIIKN